jgi:predicted dehydrogenase
MNLINLINLINLMNLINSKFLYSLFGFLLLLSCNRPTTKVQTNLGMFTGAKGEVKLITLDPGHFHAALVQKTMYETVDPVVHVYAPEGKDVMEHLGRIDSYNTRSENPTSWVEKLYTGPDYLTRMIREKAGNVVIISGNNARKTEYIHESVKAGINVLADKPMVITSQGFPLLEESFRVAAENGVILYDIMTERYEITTILQRELSMIPEIFGTLTEGTADDPAITKESVHHFFKYVSGNPLIRPAWFFDIRQQGEGIADVTTHLVDLIQWEAFPEKILDRTDVEMISARRWTTSLSSHQFNLVTGLKSYPEYLDEYIKDSLLQVYSNGEIIYKIRGICAKVSVTWNFQAPEGTGDTHYSIMKGTLCNLIIRQGKEEKFRPVLYIDLTGNENPDSFNQDLSEKFKTIVTRYPGIRLIRMDKRKWMVDIPDNYRVGHEAHFRQVTEKFLKYLQDGQLPAWEVPNMITKYYTITRALDIAGESK